MREHGGGLTFPLNRSNIRSVPIDFVSFPIKRRLFSSRKSVFPTRNAPRQLWRRRYQGQPERDRRLRKNKVCPGNRVTWAPQTGMKRDSCYSWIQATAFPAQIKVDPRLLALSENQTLFRMRAACRWRLLWIGTLLRGVRHPLPCIRLHAELCSAWEMAAAPSLDWTWQNGGHCFAVKLFLKSVASKRWRCPNPEPCCFDVPVRWRQQNRGMEEGWMDGWRG